MLLLVEERQIMLMLGMIVILQTTACAYNLATRIRLVRITVMDERNCIAQASFDLDSITNSMNPDSVL